MRPEPRKRLAAIIGAVLVGAAALASLGLAEGAPDAAPAPVDISVAAWLQGQWEGEGFGGRVEEGYSAPRAGAIVGYFRWTVGDEVKLYELCTIVQEGGTLAYRVKHFDAAFKGWEEKDRFHSFAFLRAEEGTLYFDGLTLRRTGPDSMESVVSIRGKDGQARDEVLRYRRVAILRE